MLGSWHSGAGLLAGAGLGNGGTTGAGGARGVTVPLQAPAAGRGHHQEQETFTCPAPMRSRCWVCSGARWVPGGTRGCQGRGLAPV